MNNRFLWLIPIAAILIGCEEQRPLVEYNRPLTSPGGIFSTLPPTVQNSVRAQAGAAEIDSITTFPHAGSTIYRFHFKESEIYPPLLIAADGSVLTPDLQVAVGATEESIEASTGFGSNGVKLDALPQNVVKTIRSQAPTAQVDSVHRLAMDNGTVYEVFFMDPAHHPKMFISEDGTVLTH